VRSSTTVVAVMLACLLLVWTGCRKNRPPSDPVLSGQTIGRPGDTLEFTAAATDPERDDVSYTFAWGDSSDSVWTAGSPSGTPVSQLHVFSVSQTHQVSVKARDDKELESEWSDALTVDIGMFPPERPDTPEGPSTCTTGVVYSYTTRATSPFGESLCFRFDWDDSVDTVWGGPVPGGVEYSDTHAFQTEGLHAVRAQARDFVGVVSEWSVALEASTYPGAPRTPGPPLGPDSARQRTQVQFRIATTAQGGRSFRIVADWGDSSLDTSGSLANGDTASMSHIWSDPGGFDVKAYAFLEELPAYSSGWSDAAHITVQSSTAPEPPGVRAPRHVPAGTEVEFGVWTTDPEGDKVSFKMDFGDGDTSDWTGFVASGETSRICHRYDNIGETLHVRCMARDDYALESPWCDPVGVITTEAGRLLWTWITPNEDSAGPLTAPVVEYLDANEEELAYVATDDELYQIYGVDVSDGQTKRSGHGILPDEGYDWITHPVYDWSTQHILIGKDDGELYAFKPDLSDEWHWPGMTNEEDLWPWEWGNMCLAGISIYIPNLDTIIRGNDTIDGVTKFFKITDSPVRPVNPPFTVLGVQEVLGAPVADIAINVYFVTDSGNLFKMNQNIQVQWRARFTQKRGVFGPVIGAGGVVYCGDEDGKVYAYESDGDRKWDHVLAGVRKMRLVVGKQYLFAACDNGHVYALDPATGGEVWDKHVSNDASISVYPILTKNGYMYVVNENTKLFCLVQATGEELWNIACPDHYTGGTRPRCGGIKEPPPSPALTRDGNIIIASKDALYCVSGYRDGTLDDGPWPKWQSDNYNTGRCPVGP
jgi:outer membrane protein assembly factor BamB